MQGYECPGIFAGQGGGEVDSFGLYAKFLDKCRDIVYTGFQQKTADLGWQLGNGFSKGYQDKR